MANLKELDPVQGLVDYVLDIKPYHTKIVEVLVEYIHTEPVDVTILDNHEMDITVQNPPGYFDIDGVLQPGSLLEPGVLFKYECTTGFDTSTYSSRQLLITSPNPDKSFEAFPAINPGLNTFVLNGNVSTDIKIGDVLYLNSVIEDFTNVHTLYSINSGIAGTASFVVLGDVTGQFQPAGYTFTAFNAGVNNGTYVTDALPIFDGTVTTITVLQSIASSTTGGVIGLETTIGAHNGFFTVADVEFDQGSIDYLEVSDDPLTQRLGNNPHTIVTVVESLAAIPALTATNSYVVTVMLDPIEVELALSYSRAEKIYDPSGPTYVQAPNEGTNRNPILGLTLSTVVGGIPIPDSGKFIIAGDFRTSNVFTGDALKIDSSVGNNGTYTITSIAYDVGQDETTLGVAELVDDPIVDGFGTITIPSNVFFVDGNRTSQFTQGRQFNMTGGSFENTYTILRSDFTQGKTRVRTAETIFDIGAGNIILGTTGGFIVPGDQTGIYTVGTAFNVIRSPQNDGPYVVDVAGTTFDVGTGLSTIPVSETLDSTPGGELHIAMQGAFKQHYYGFDENSPLCGIVPDTIVAVYFNEKVKFTGIGIELRDDLIAYNLENTDPGGFEFPLDTIVDTLEPAVPEQPTAPLTPARLDLWYDTASDIFRQWSGYEWKTIKTANWFDTDDNILYYRTRDKFVDTGWVLDSIRFPGFSDFIPAVGETVEIDKQLFTANEISPGVPNTSFTLNTAVPGSDNTLLKVTVNSIAAAATLTSANDFTVTSPPMTIGDFVVATVYDRTATETNAHVSAIDVQPHMVLHRTVTTDIANDAYIVSGGNFIDRFIPFNNFEVFDTSASPANLGTQNATSLPVVDVDDEAGTITIVDDYTWLFTANRIFRVNPSVRNYNDFEVQSSSFDGTNTIIVVLPTPFESSNDDTDATQQYFYNPPLPIITIDNTFDELVVPGNVVESFPVNLEILIEGSTAGNSIVWTVASTTYDSGNDRTNVFVTGNIPDPDATGNATVSTPIFQNYSKDLGVIVGAIFEPDVNGTYATGQPKTIVLPSTPILSATANIIEYMWVGPVRFDISMRHVDTSITSISDGLLLGNELTGGALNTLIYDTDATANTFTIRYTDPITSDPVNLSDRFGPGTIFSVYGSYGISVPPAAESNDALYTVNSVTFDGTDTVITIETDYNEIPPYNSFDVVELDNHILNIDQIEAVFGVSNPTFNIGFSYVVGSGELDVMRDGVIQTVGVDYTETNSTTVDWIGSPLGTDVDDLEVMTFRIVDSLPTMTLTGDHVNLFENFTNPVFRLDQPIIDLNQLDNVMTVTKVELLTSPTRTVLTIDNDFIDESFTGALGIIEAIYRGNIFFDNQPPGDLGQGSVIISGSSSATLTATTFTDDLIFGWGDVLRWWITDVDFAGSSVDLKGNYEAVIFPNDRFSIVGSDNIDGDYEAVSATYDAPSDTSTMVVANPILPADPVTSNINVTIISADSTGNTFTVDGEDGKHSDFLITGATFDVIGSASNDGTYTVVTSTYSSGNDTLLIAVASVPTDDASGDVQYTKKLAGQLEMDSIDITSWFQYNIIKFNYITNTITVLDDVTVDLFSGQEIRVLGTTANNGVFTVDGAPTYDSVTNTSTVTVIAPTNPGINPIVQYISALEIQVQGSAALHLQGDDVIELSGSGGNDGFYTVQGVTFDGVFSFVTIKNSTFPNIVAVGGDLYFNEGGGWIESLRYQGINLWFEDVLATTMIETVDALILSSGSLVSAWDYNYFDVGSFDEDLGTLIHLYSNTF